METTTRNVVQSGEDSGQGQTGKQGRKALLKYLLLSSFVGLIYALAIFPNLLSSLAEWFFEPGVIRDYILFFIRSFRDLLQSYIGADAANTFPTIMTFNFVCLWIFFAASVLFSIRHLDARLALFSLLGVTGVVAAGWVWGAQVWRIFVEFISPITDVIVNFVTRFVWPMLVVVGAILAWLFVALLALLSIFFVLSTLGNVVIDQVKAVWHASRSAKGIAIAGFAIGLAFALVMFMSVGAQEISAGFDAGWLLSFQLLDTFLATQIAQTVGPSPTGIFIGTMPQAVETFVFEYFTLTFPPLIDAILLGTVLSIATLRVIGGIAWQSDLPAADVTFLPREYLIIVWGVLVGTLLAIIGAVVEPDRE